MLEVKGPKENSNKKIAFFINHGVEVRHFILSGLFQSASLKNEAVILMKEYVGSEFLKDYINTDAILYFNDIEIKQRHPLEGMIGAVRKARLRLLQIGNFHNFNDNKSKKVKDLAIGNQISFFFSSIIGRRILQKHYTDKKMVSFFKKEGVTMIFMLDYNDPFQLQIGFSANKAGIPVKIIINTLKSFYINDFIPFQVKELYTWNERQKELFIKSNSHQSKKSFLASGNPYHSFIFAAHDLNIIDKNVSALEGTPFILYSLIYEKMYDSEFEILKYINTFINENYKTNKPKIVIRRNPFEEKNFNIEQFKSFDNLIIAPHSWERKAEYEWSIQAYKGEAEWKFLLEKATLVLNITSIAGIEAIFSGTPVINIGFNGQGFEDPKLKRFTYAPFLIDVLASDFVKLALNSGDFKNAFTDMYTVKVKFTKEQIQNSINIVKFNTTQYQQMLN